MTYTVESDIPIAKAEKTRFAKESKYPFARMAVNESFFIPSTIERPRPWKTKGPVIHWANRRFAPCKFKIHKFVHDERGLGAMIWRVE